MKNYPLYLNGEFITTEQVKAVINPPRLNHLRISPPLIALAWHKQLLMLTLLLPDGEN